MWCVIVVYRTLAKLCCFKCPLLVPWFKLICGLQDFFFFFVWHLQKLELLITDINKHNWWQKQEWKQMNEFLLNWNFQQTFLDYFCVSRSKIKLTVMLENYLFNFLLIRQSFQQNFFLKRALFYWLTVIV